jgi:hypothetical protein
MTQKKRCLFLILAFMSSSLWAGGGVIFSNSGFETGLSPWKISLYDTTKALATVSIDSANAMFGKKYCKITVTKVDADSASNNWYVQLWEPTWQSKPNINYTYTCWARTTDSMSRLIHIAYTGDTASEYTYINGSSFTLTQEWQQCQVSYTWTNPGTSQKRHFRIFAGGAKGEYCFDSMALDTITVAVKYPLALSSAKKSAPYSIDLLPECLRLVFRNSPEAMNRVAVYSLAGRLISSQEIPASTTLFEIPKPARGAWVVGVNSDKKMITVP